MGLAAEFKEFAMKGNVVDLAVGVVIGTAFGKIVSALVEHVIMPPLGVLLAGMDFNEAAARISTAADGTPVLLKYGLFIQAMIDFIIIAFVLFIALKGINRLKRPRPNAPPAALPAEQVLLAEIRDLLKQRADAETRRP